MKKISTDHPPSLESSRRSKFRDRMEVVKRPWVIALLFFVPLSMAAWKVTAQTTLPQITMPMRPPGMAAIIKKALRAPMLPSSITGVPPATIDTYTTTIDPTGIITTYQPMTTQNPSGQTTTANNSFFNPELTTNGRTCFTCHQPQNDWEISPPQIMAQYFTSRGQSALFQPIDAAVCPDTKLLSNRFLDPRFILSRIQLFRRGNFRISLNAPFNPNAPDYKTFDGNINPQWRVKVLYDPYGCEMDPTYGLPSNQLSVYRRPLNATNVVFLDQDPGYYDNTGAISPEERQEIMWDAREPDLASQFVDADEYHGQTTVNPDTIVPGSIAQGVLFQSGLFTAQTYDFRAGDLTGNDGSGALGGPEYLYSSLNLRNPACVSFTPGMTPVETGPFAFVPPIPPAPGAFGQLACPGNLSAGALGGGGSTEFFDAFASPTGNYTQKALRESIQRGEAIFNGRSVTFAITDVAGLDDLGIPPVVTNNASCSFCHNNKNAANDAAGDPKRLGIMDNSNKTDNGDVVKVMPFAPDFPRFAFFCPSGTIPYFSNPVYDAKDCPGGTTPCDEFITTDPGKGLITGLCTDLGKMKVPILRGVVARAPYFHGGNAMTLMDVVNFYNNRFNIGLTAQQKQDLVNYLSSL